MDGLQIFILICAGLSAAVWIYLTLFHHGFWRRREFLDENLGDTCLNAAGQQMDWPAVTAIIPARNEEDGIARALNSLTAQDYPGPFRIILVNDSSEDATVAEAERAMASSASDIEVTIIHAPNLETGWSGKLWALKSGLDYAAQQAQTPASQAEPQASYYWLSDADIAHAPDVLRGLVALSARQDHGLTSLMVTLNCTQAWEKRIIPAFIYYFQKLYPFKASADPNSTIAGAAGGCVLMRREALEAIGGIEAIRETLIDDCALAAAVKHKGYKIWLGHGVKSHSLRVSNGLTELWRMVTRTAFTQLNFSYFRLCVASIGMVITYLIPPLALIWGGISGHTETTILGGFAWVLMTLTYIPTIRAYGRPAWAAIALPFTASLFLAMTIESGWLHFKGTHSGWRGRIYKDDNV